MQKTPKKDIGQAITNSGFSASQPCTSILLTLHLGHGLRPMKKIKTKFAYVQRPVVKESVIRKGTIL